MSRKRHVVAGYTPCLLVLLVASNCQLLANGNHTLASNTTELGSEAETLPSTTHLATTVVTENATQLYTTETEVYLSTTETPVPDPPEELLCIPLNSSAMELTWRPVYKADGYNIRWQALNDTSDAGNMTVGGNETSFVIGNLQAWTEYNVSVSATREGKVSDPAIITNKTQPAAPCPPRDLYLRQEEQPPPKVLVTWEEPACRNGPLDGYEILWKRRGVARRESIIVGGTVTSYLVGKLDNWTEYEFAVRAFNYLQNKMLNSSETKKTIKTQAGVPCRPENVQHKEPDVNSNNPTLLIWWNRPSCTNGPLSGYIIFWQEGGRRGVEKDIPSTQTSYSIGGVRPWAEYKVSVVAYNKVENRKLKSEPAKLQIRTSPATPGPPTNLTLEYNETGMNATWNPPNPTNGPVTGYNLKVTEGHCLSDLSNEEWETINETEYFNNSLFPATNYSFYVRAFTEWNETVLPGIVECRNFTTHDGFPLPPTDLSCLGSTGNTIGISWKEPKPKQGDILGYSIRYSKAVGGTALYKDVGSSRTHVALDELEPYTSYNISVSASTSKGPGEWSQHITCKTKATVPGAIRNLRLNCSFSSNTVIVWWEPPNDPNGELEYYLIQYVGGKGDKTDRDEIKVHANVRGHAVTETVPSLYPEFSYTFFVYAKVHDVDGLSDPVRETCTLPAGLPPPPQKNISVIETFRKEIKFVIQNNTFLDTEGDIVEYAVVVAEAKNIGSNESRRRDTEDLPTWSEFQKNDSLRYRATPDKWNPFNGEENDPMKCKLESLGVTCVLGCQLKCGVGPYCNGPLTPGVSYGIKLRGYTSAGFAETFPVVADTTSEPSNATKGILITVCVMIVILFSIVAAAFAYRKWGGQRVSGLIEALSPRRLLKSTKMSRTAQSNDNVGVAPPVQNTRPIKFPEFSKHVTEMISDSRLKFSLEFEEVKKISPSHPTTAAQLPENRPKNRWVNILPFDHSRVKLLPVDDEPASDYINASYIPGFTCHREYIASQGPLPGTVDDMWRMIWEQGVNTIVMLTQCVERGKAKCEQYWPEEKQTGTYGDLEVHTVCQSVLPEYTVRTFDLSLASRHRVVTQMHFTKWPDFGCPENTESLIEFVLATRKHVNESDSSPLLVHCSAGVGRTGTFIAVDRLIQHLEKHDFADVFHVVLDMREHRTNMVQTEDQYVYIHECVRDLIQSKLARDQESIKDDHIYGNIGVQATTNV